MFFLSTFLSLYLSFTVNSINPIFTLWFVISVDTKFLDFLGMRYVELRPPISSLPCGLHEWLEDELDCRGVPSPVIYARYILSLLAQDQLRVTDFLEESLNSKQDRRNSSTLPTLRRTKPRFTLNNYIQEEDAIVLAKHPCSKVRPLESLSCLIMP